MPAEDPEPLPPPQLSAVQQAFASAMRTPFEFHDDRDDVRITTSAYPASIVAEMVARPPLGGAERLAVYNRQYWYRLFSVLQEEYPLLCRLLAVERFNRMASAFLHRHPSRSPLLRDLSQALPDFLVADPVWADPMLAECAQLEWLRIVAFDAADRPVLDADLAQQLGERRLLHEPLAFQPHCALFEEHHALVELRRALDRDVAAPLALPPREEHACWVLWRSAQGPRAERVAEVAFGLLRRLRDGVPLADACAQLDASVSAEARAQLAESLGGWFASWRDRGWFAAP